MSSSIKSFQTKQKIKRTTIDSLKQNEFCKKKIKHVNKINIYTNFWYLVYELRFTKKYIYCNDSIIKSYQLILRLIRWN